jgi:SAM-dependent methyltransferase
VNGGSGSRQEDATTVRETGDGEDAMRTVRETGDGEDAMRTVRETGDGERRDERAAMGHRERGGERVAGAGHGRHGGEFEGLGGLVLGWLMGFGRGRSARQIVELARVGAGDRVVDVGCGPGRFLVEAAERGATVVGVDPSSQMRRLARRRTEPLRSAVTVVDGSAERLPLDDGAATVAWAVASFHHWSDPDAGLAELHRVLEPGGRFLIAERPARSRGLLRHHALSSSAAEDLVARTERAGFSGVTVATHRLGRHQLLVVAGHRPAAGQVPPAGGQ